MKLRVLCGLLLAPWCALAASAVQGVEPDIERFVAVRTTEPPHIDGRLDEATWRQASVFSSFHQSLPQPGEPPSERTEVRVLYDDVNLYVGIRCFDHQPQAINAQVGVRDDIPSSDTVSVMIDSQRDRRTANRFSLNAGNTHEDARLYEDTQEDSSWNGIWQGRATRDDQGWSAELRIPLELLHFPRVEEQRWGFHVRRYLARTNEQLDSVPLPPTVNALVSRFTELRGLVDLDPQRALTLIPYVATRLTRGPGPSPAPGALRLSEPSADLGLDLQVGLSSELSLVLTVNPEFGEAEADELVVNLTTAELEFPEKRPFFQQGLELFKPRVAEESGLSEQSLFYSRRVGLEPGLPLLGAVKLSGTVHKGVRVSVLDAVVAGEADPNADLTVEPGEAPDAHPPERDFRFRPWRPLHFARDSSLPAQVLPPTHYFAGTTRLQMAPGGTVGATATLATPLSSRCHWGVPTAEDEGCRPRGGHALALDTSLQSPSADYQVAAQVTGSQVTGGPRGGLLMQDGTLLSDKDTGLGFQLSGGRLGGEPWRMLVSYGYSSPRLELNPTGYQPLQNMQEILVRPQLVQTRWKGIPEATMALQGTQRWSTDARGLPLGTRFDLITSLLLANSSYGSCDLGAELGRKDLREIPQAGIAFQRPSLMLASCSFSSAANQPLSVMATVYVDRPLSLRVAQWLPGQQLALQLTWRPMPRLQTTLDLAYTSSFEGPRFLGQVEPGLFLFGDQTPRFLTLAVRQLVALTPTLTLQMFAKSLSGYMRYENLSEASSERGAQVRSVDLRPSMVVEAPSLQQAQLTLNAVLRWEYSVGSTLFIVYSRAQKAHVAFEGDTSRLTLLPRGLLGGAHTDLILLKLQHAF